jgi:hypothetical protein
MGEIFMRVTATALALVVGQPAYAHHSWISSHRFRDPVSNEWCCNANDCSALEDERVREIAHEFIVDDRYIVASKRVLPSHDGRYWACFEPGGIHGHGPKRSIRCFFAPMEM